MVQANAINYFSPARWVVSQTAGEGTHTTIASALTSASNGEAIAILPGTYTENLTLKQGVALTSMQPSQRGSHVVIVGKMIDNGSSVACRISGIELKTNNDFLIQLTGSGSSVSCTDCVITCLNNTGCSVGSGATLELYACTGDVSTTGIGFCTGAGTIKLYQTYLTNSGSSTTSSSMSGGITLTGSSIGSPLATTSSGRVDAYRSTFDTSGINTTAITTAGTGNMVLYHSNILTGTASAISIGSGTLVECYDCVVNSTNTNPVTGAGTYKSDNTTYSNTGVLPNPTTETFAQVGRYGTWTPTLDGATPGSTTYSTQVGQYHRIGNLVWIQGQIVITAATGTGNATIGGLPYTIKNVTSGSPIGSIRAANATWAWPATTTHMVLTGTVNTTTCVINCTSSSNNPANLQMTNGAITMIFTMVYEAA